MNAATHLLVQLQRRGIELRPQGENIAFRPQAAMTRELRDQLAAHKAELLAMLRSDPELGCPIPQPVPLSIFELVACTRGACRMCGNVIFWRLRSGQELVCAVCHPPMPPPDQLEWRRGHDVGGRS